MSNISEMMGTTMEKVKEMVDANSVVGTPITTPDGTTLIPVSKVTFGFASGGTDGQNIRYGAGSGAGVTIAPVAFIVISSGNVRMIYLEAPTNGAVDKIIDMVPGAIDKLQSLKQEKKEQDPVY